MKRPGHARGRWWRILGERVALILHGVFYGVVGPDRIATWRRTDPSMESAAGVVLRLTAGGCRGKSASCGWVLDRTQTEIERANCWR